jgi:hypothetical protein
VWKWLAFFTVCAAICIIRSTFHLAWFVMMVWFARWALGRQRWRGVLVAASVPGLVLVALYGKNFLLFGEFAASTFGPASLHLATVDRMPHDVRDRWIAQGVLSPFAAISVYAPPRTFQPFFGSSVRAGWPPQVTRLEHPSVRAANFNHWFLLEVHRARRADVLVSLRRRFPDYLGAIGRGLVDFLSPSTEWHPRTGTPESPHAQHRQVLGRYEAWFNRLVHGLPIPPVGLYLALPLVILCSAWRALGLLGQQAREYRARGLLIAFCLLQILYVTGASTMLTFLESSRYRFQVEPFIWLMAALCLSRLRPAPRHEG